MIALQRLRLATATLLLALLTVACGAGSGPLAEGGIGGSGISMGSVSGFGSVFVNGVEYATDGDTQYVIGGASWVGGDDRSLLALGMVVRVEGQVNSDGVTGKADRIIYDSSLRGPVAGVDAAAAQFRLLGQLVRVSATTRFVGSNGSGAVTGLPSLLADDYVEVSGFLGAGGDFYATWVEVNGAWTADREVEVEDVIGGVDAGGNSFTLVSGLAVDFGAAARDFTPAAGQLVEVTGTYDGARLQACGLARHDGLIVGEDGDDVEVEGVITLVDGNLLTVNGVTVRITAGTDTGGIDPFTAGMRIEAEGELQGGELVAEEIELKAESEYEFEGEVLAVDRSASTVTLFGRAIAVTANTMIGEKALFFDEENGVQEGDYLSIHAAVDGVTLVATEIEFEDAGSEQELEGPIDSKDAAARTVVVAGITVDLSAPQFDALFAALAAGSRIDVVGLWDGAVFTATGLDD